MKVFGREPAVIVGVVEAAIALALTFGLAWTQDQVVLVMAAVTAVLGVLVAYLTRDTMLGAVTGLAKSLLILAVGFGWPLDDGQVAGLMAFITILGSAFNRTQTSPLVTPSFATEG